MPIMNSENLAADLKALAESEISPQTLMKAIVTKLSANPKYNWVGFYMIENETSGEPILVLGPYSGAPTPHTRIALGQGICGAAASSGETVVVDDVNSDPRYLACSIETRSEIVAPVYAGGRVVGELDIDSHSHAAFGAEDQRICELAARLVGKSIEAHASKDRQGT
ncbi:MAG TPA: GAF domain-containing protein [Terriglobales bacterium]|nr:GAF domain-containing protein [Terriglobales bacterium]